VNWYSRTFNKDPERRNNEDAPVRIPGAVFNPGQVDQAERIQEVATE